MATERVKIQPSEKFVLVKHPDLKKYMHYALKNGDNQWVQYGENGSLQAGPKISWFALVPSDENTPD